MNTPESEDRADMYRPNIMWTKVSDRLPACDTPILGVVNGYIGVYERFDTGDGWLWAVQTCPWDFFGNQFEADEDYEVTHWRYLEKFDREAWQAEGKTG